MTLKVLLAIFYFFVAAFLWVMLVGYSHASVQPLVDDDPGHQPTWRERIHADQRVKRWMPDGKVWCLQGFLEWSCGTWKDAE